MKKKYIIPEVALEQMDLEDGVMLEISFTEADLKDTVLVPETDGIDFWNFDDDSIVL